MKTHDGMIEFVVDRDDLDEALAVVKEKSNYHCIIGTKSLGEQILVQVLGFSLAPEESSSMEHRLQELAHVQSFSAGKAEREEQF